MSKNLQNNVRPKIILGITGSVAAIKTNELMSSLTHWADIKIVVTEKAKSFLDSNTDFIDDSKEWETWKSKGDPILHIELRRWADLFLIAPLTANTQAKIAYGFSDNLLTSIAKAWDFNKPFVIAPAMNTNMWDHPTSKEQIKRLTTWNIKVINPINKILACGDEGLGAMEEPSRISAILKNILIA